MRLYPKKLRSIEDLEREKKLLLRESKQLDKEDLFSVEGLLGKKGKNDREDGDGSLLDYLPISNPLVSIGIKMAQRWFSQRKNKQQTEPEDDSPHPKGKSALRTIAVEVIGGYLKWKAVELSIKGVRHIIKTRKEKKEQ